MEAIIEEKVKYIQKESPLIIMIEVKETIILGRTNMKSNIKRSRNLPKRKTTQIKKNKKYKLKMNLQKNN